MPEGLKDARDIATEQLTYKDTILTTVRMIPYAIKEGLNNPPGTSQKAGLYAIYGLVVNLHCMVALKASITYQEEAKEYFESLKPRDWGDEVKRQEAFLKIARWNERIIKEFPQLGIVEPNLSTDIIGSKQQIMDYIWDLMGTLSKNELAFLVDKAYNENHFIDQHIPSGHGDYDDSELEIYKARLAGREDGKSDS